MRIYQDKWSEHRKKTLKDFYFSVGKCQKIVTRYKRRQRSSYICLRDCNKPHRRAADVSDMVDFYIESDVLLYFAWKNGIAGRKIMKIFGGKKFFKKKDLLKIVKEIK